MVRREYGFFDLFNRHTATTLDGARCLVTIAEEWPEAAGRVRRVEELEHECDSITHMTIDLLHRTFITPLDRDEVIRLISKMDDVMDSIERAAKRMLLFEIEKLPKKLGEMIRVLCRAQEQVVAIVEMIHGFKHGGKLRELIKEIHRLENEGDGLHHAGLTQLFRENANDPLTVIKLKEIYETIEQGIDQCEDIANIVETIVLEHF
jgi:predicted phosphate transport protein (TIGR00153 family)